MCFSQLQSHAHLCHLTSSIHLRLSPLGQCLAIPRCRSAVSLPPPLLGRSSHPPPSSPRVRESSSPNHRCHLLSRCNIRYLAPTASNRFKSSPEFRKCRNSGRHRWRRGCVAGQMGSHAVSPQPPLHRSLRRRVQRFSRKYAHPHLPLLRLGRSLLLTSTPLK